MQTKYDDRRRGALFAAFPHVYATLFSGFYLALILLIVVLIVRVWVSNSAANARRRAGEVFGIG